ncbi:MAG TPA: maleylpyruvate isomerase N-terminal domain-containing protein, partial [Acidimicrobiales bacterium]
MADRLVLGGDQDSWFAQVAERRHDLAGYLRDLPADRWRMPSLCGGWTVREVAGHLVTPMLMGVPRIGWEIVKSGLSFDRGMDRLARRFARLPTADLAD